MGTGRKNKQEYGIYYFSNKYLESRRARVYVPLSGKRNMNIPERVHQRLKERTRRVSIVRGTIRSR